MKRLKVGEYREGTVLSKRNEDMLVDIGVEQPAVVRGKHLALGKRITVKIADADRQIKAELANREEIPEYWGYSIAAKQSFGEMVKQKDFDCIIATSKHGRAFRDVVDVIAEKWRTAHRSLVAFGAPTHGLNEIAEEEGLDLSTIADIVVNTIPDQGTETVRTEEAVLASLAILNTLNL
jgi:predicted SPOUT superfamily RNA methylase MTH1